MKKLIFLTAFFLGFLTITLAQENYTGGAKPDNYHQTILPPTSGAREWTGCLPCAIPEGEPPIIDDIGDLTNYGCNGYEFEPDRPELFSSITLGDVICGTGEQYSYLGTPFRDTDWYRFVLTTSKDLYWTSIANFPTYIFIIQGPCQLPYPPVLQSQYVPAGTTGQIHQLLPTGEYYFWIGPSYWGPEFEGDYMVTLTEGLPQTDWCRNKVPVSDWAIVIGLILIASFAMVRYYRGR